MTATLTENQATARTPEWQRALTRGMFAYLLSRVLVVLGAGVGIAAHAVRDRWEDKVPVEGIHALIRVFDSWDGHWYMDVARDGYPHDIQANVTYFVSDARAAFFPLYPRTVHYLDMLLPGAPSASPSRSTSCSGDCSFTSSAASRANSSTTGPPSAR